MGWNARKDKMIGDLLDYENRKLAIELLEIIEEKLHTTIKGEVWYELEDLLVDILEKAK